jgi:hypothetical protein
MNIKHSNRDERKAADVMFLSSALSARPSTAAQNDEKKSARGDEDCDDANI